MASICRVLDAAGIAYTGVGQTPEEAAKPYIFECDGKKIGVYACAEHEFSIVTEYTAGANPIDLLETPDHIAALKAECDYVIVLYHGGKEYYRYPSPNLQKVCRKLVEKGADLVVCQHSHCIGCEERIRGGTIVYGQGNFLFDDCDNEFWQTRLLIQIRDGFTIDYIPLLKHGNKVRLAVAKDAETIMNGFRQRTNDIMRDEFIGEKYREFSQQSLPGYLRVMFGKKPGIIVRIVNKFSGYRYLDWLMKRRYSATKLLPILNYMECEAHRGLQIFAVKDRLR